MDAHRPSLPWGAPGSAGSFAGPTKGNYKKHCPQTLTGAAQHGHHVAGPLRSGEMAWLPLRSCGRAGGAQHGPRSQGQDRTRRAPLNPQHLRTPPGPISPATTSDSQGDRALRPGAQTLRAGERWLVGCRQAHRWSPGPVRTCVPREALTRKGGLGEDGVAPGWQDSAQRGSEGHAACLPGGEGRPSPQPSPRACAGQGSCTLQGDSGCGVGVPTAGAQTMLSTNTGEGVWRQRARAPRAWPTHQRDPGG